MMDQEVFGEILLIVSSLINLISVDHYFTRALRRFATCRKLASSLELPTIFDDNLNTTSVSFFLFETLIY